MTEPNLTEPMRIALLQAVFQTMDQGAVVIDRECTVLLANRSIEARARTTPAAGEKCYAALWGRDDKCPECAFTVSAETGAPTRQEMEVTSPDGSTNWVELCCYPLRDAQGAIVAAVEHVKDVTGRRQLEQHLRDESIRSQVLVGQSPDGVVVLGLSGEVLEVNEQFARILGYTVEEVRRLHIWDWDKDTDRGRLLYMLETAESVRDHYQHVYRRKDGTAIQVEVYSSGAVVGERMRIFHVCRDVTAKTTMERQIQEIAVRDPLTDLYNGRYMLERLSEISAEYRRGRDDFCVSIMDIDDFRAIHQAHGNKGADEALKELAQTVGAAVRPYDLLGRFSSDQFILISRSTPGIQTTAMMERIMAKVRKLSFSYQGKSIRLTLSCGLAYSSEFRREGFTGKAVIARAELRLDEARSSGKNRYVGLPADKEPREEPAPT